MSIPTYQTIMLPLLQIAADGQSHRTRDAIAELAKHFVLTEDELSQLTKGGQDYVFANRIGWARTYLKKAGLIHYTSWGNFQITEAGRELLKSHPAAIDLTILKKYPDFLTFYNGPQTSEIESSQSVSTANLTEIVEATPDELIATAHADLRKQIQSELLSNIMDSSPAYFERLVVTLLTTMGYGGSREDAGQAIGKSHDGGVDGEIKEDKLGLDTIYIQAKRWQENVGAKEVREFVGALHGRRAHKGVFIATSKFTKEAVAYAANLDKKVVLINGEQLTELMFDYGLGVTATATYVTKRIDYDFFEKDVV